MAALPGQATVQSSFMAQVASSSSPAQYLSHRSRHCSDGQAAAQSNTASVVVVEGVVVVVVVAVVMVVAAQVPSVAQWGRHFQVLVRGARGLVIARVAATRRPRAVLVGAADVVGARLARGVGRRAAGAGLALTAGRAHRAPGAAAGKLPDR